MSVRSFRIQLGLGLLALFVSLPARAGQREDIARSEVAAGTAAYNLGYYEDAARHYEEAYRQVPDPVLLFDIGQAYRLAGKPDRAITAYRSYLRTAPADVANRAQVERRIPELEKLVEQMKSAQTAPPPGTLPPAAPPASPPAQGQGSVTPAAASPVGAAPAQQSASSTQTPTALPVPASPETQPGAGVPPGADLHAAVPAGESPPVYKTWWFWTGVGVVVVGGVVAAVLLSSGSSKGIPGTTLGNQPIFQ